jgi:hypothetical protein
MKRESESPNLFSRVISSFFINFNLVFSSLTLCRPLKRASLELLMIPFPRANPSTSLRAGARG